jgi:Tfp pilus assembly protein PilF
MMRITTALAYIAMNLAAVAGALAVSAPTQDPIAYAMEALQRNDLASAERILREHVQAHATDGEAFALLAVVLDQEKKYSEAERCYRRAFSLSGPNVALLNNYGNHLVSLKQPKEASLQFQKAAALESGNVNARIQLARLSLEQKFAAEALIHLGHLPAGLQKRFDIALMRMQADYELRNASAANAICDRLSSEAQNDATATVALGVALSASGRYEHAEQLFDHAAALQPDNFDAIYYGGLAASHAGHLQHARDLLERALQLQPGNVDVLYDAAVVDAKLGRGDSALTRLASASRIAPQRADIGGLIARLTARLGYFEDSLKAWDRYLQLKPDDSSALRERAYIKTEIPERSAAGLKELQNYLRNRPDDAIAHYELGTVESGIDLESAAKEFARAIALKPDFAPARFARGLLLSRQADPGAALQDFQFVAAHEPGKAAVLDRLGETLLQLKRPTEAVDTLRRAAQIDPENSTVLLHLGRALMKTEHNDEARLVFERAREIGPARPVAAHSAGLLDHLMLTPEEQLARYRSGVERTVQLHPENLEAEVHYLRLLLEDGKSEPAVAVAIKIASLKPNSVLIRETETALLGAQEFDAAKQFRAALSKESNE